ncbi:MAG: MBL fold metallo-hydrolase [Pseudomonadota bacterium]
MHTSDEFAPREEALTLGHRLALDCLRVISAPMDGAQNKTVGRTRPIYPFGNDIPASGETMEIAPGIHWACMEVPFALKWVNVYLIDEGDGWSIVDTGMPMDDTKAAWRKILENTMRGAPLKRVIATHMHPDHIGLAGWFHRKTGADLWISRLEYVTCRMLCADTGRAAPDVAIRFFERAGWEPHNIQDYRNRFGSFGRGVTRLPDSFIRMTGGDQIDMGAHTWTVVHGSGHSPEHACLYSPDLNILMAGDQLLPRISSNVSVHPTEPDADPLTDWLNSCAHLKESIPADVLVLPGHNEPFTGAHDRLQALIDGHEKALQRLKKRLGEAPRRVVDTFPALFARKIGDDMIGLATGEALAHLNCLIHRGEAIRESQNDGVDLYRTVN